MTTDLHYNAQAVPSSEPVTIVLTVILLLIFFVGLFSVFFFKCFLESILNTWNLTRTPSGHFVNMSDDKVSCGLDPKQIQTFPTFCYSSFEVSQPENCCLECTICLTEFEEDSLIRLLTICRHIFHQGCIDIWFESHKTCPICRVDLDMPQKLLDIPLTNDNDVATNDMNENNCVLEDAISIDIREGVLDEIISTHATPSYVLGRNEVLENVGTLSRSESTGHFLSKNGEADEIYTLRLSEHVKVNSARHYRVRSCITFGEMPSQSNFSIGGVGRVSRRPNRYVNR